MILLGWAGLGCSKGAGFSLNRLDMGEICPPHMGGISAGDKALMGDIDLMGVPNFDRLYHKLKVLLLLLILL